MNRIAVIGACVVVLFAGLLLWLIRTGKSPAPATTVQQSPATAATQAQQATPPDPLLQNIDAIVARYRKTIVLLDETDSLPETDRDQVSLVGKIIFQENHEALSTLSNDLTSDIENAGDFSKP